ncbi:hypothetical protein IWW39_005788 [Coemansia spiralis]|uniref:Pentatricopeptide repeat-containing protein n=1 Tax=Coemansia spiralis TaxID=417178 RepID=A0A9W8GDV9_9FUNG|nr:hypothetical protein IWW39_005788 [Coemansia spiralis]
MFKPRTARLVPSLSAYLRLQGGTQSRSLSELYFRMKQEEQEQKPEIKDEHVKENPQQQEPAVAPPPLSYLALDKHSSKMAQKQLLQDKEEANRLFEKMAAETYISGLHKGKWSSDETWIRFCLLPIESRKFLRDIDVNRTLARIRGTDKDAALGGKAIPTSRTLTKMLAVLGSAKRAGVVPDQYTYQEMIAINASLLNFSHALEWLDKMIKGGIQPTIRPYRTLLKGYSTIPSEIDNTRQLWKSIKSKIEHGLIAPSEPDATVATIDIKSYTCMLAAECRVGNFEQALSLLDEMEAAGLQPDITVRNVLLEGIVRHKGLDAGLRESELMEQSGFELDGFTYSTLLMAAIKEGRSEETERLLSTSAAKGFLPSRRIVQLLPIDPLYVLDILTKSGAIDTIRVYNTLIQAAVRRNNFNQALQLIAHLRSHGAKPNVVTYGLLLDALSKAGQLTQAKAMFKEVFEGGSVEPDMHIFTTMIDACGRSGDIVAMFGFKDAMKNYNLPPAEPVYNSILSSLSRQRNSNLKLVMATVNELVHCTPPVRPSILTYNAIFAAFAAYARRKSLNSGELRFLRTWYANTRDKYYIVKDRYLYVSALNAFVGAGCIEDSMLVYEDMMRHAELDAVVLLEFTRKPKHMLELMNLAVEAQRFDDVLALWRNWQALGLPPSEQALGLVLYACDQLGHISVAKDIVMGLLSPRGLSSTSEKVAVDGDAAIGDIEEYKELHRRKMAVSTAYSPSTVGESALAIFIGILVKHNMVDDIVPALELWNSAGDAAALAASSSLRFGLTHDVKRVLSETTVSRLLKLLWQSKHKDAGKATDQILAFVEKHFPEAMPV